jgi:hypothetical protein
MDESNKRSLDDSVQNSPFSFKAQGDVLSEQHMTPVPQTLGVSVVRGKKELDFTFSFHWTVRMRVTHMTDRTASILLKVLVCQQLINGIDFTGYIAIEYLVSYLMRGKLDVLEIREEKDRQTVMLGTLILSCVRGTWINLIDRISISPAVINDIASTGWLPTKRTLASWKEYFRPESFLEVLTVPLEAYGERETSSIRYSSYTKGYGNGGHVSRTKKTPYSSEIDGESTDREPPDFNLQEIEQYNRILLALEREKIERLYQKK